MYEIVWGEGGVFWECGFFFLPVKYIMILCELLLGKGGNYIFSGQGE